MCGRFVLHHAPDTWLAELAPKWSSDSFPFNFQARYNIAPTQPVFCVYVDGETGLRLVEPLRWGLLPFWAKEISMGVRMINARSETVSEKPAYRAAYKSRRCLIPADGYYEWKKVGKSKQPYYIHPPNEQPFAMAGLWEENAKVDPSGEAIRTCTVLTTAANETTSAVHDRMPVMIESKDYDRWLDPSYENRDDFQSLFESAPNDRFALRPVNRAVGNVRNEGATLIREVELDFE